MEERKHSKEYSSGHHGPQNAEHELRKAYALVMDIGLTYRWDRKGAGGPPPEEVQEFYKRGYDAFRQGDRLTAERWARTVKHLGRALEHEARIAWLRTHDTLAPFPDGGKPEDLGITEHSDTAEDLINSVAEHTPPGMNEMPMEMRRYLGRAREHLDQLKSPDLKHEFIRGQHIQAAHEYGRVLECISLAYEAEAKGGNRGAA